MVSLSHVGGSVTILAMLSRSLVRAVFRWREESGVVPRWLIREWHLQLYSVRAVGIVRLKHIIGAFAAISPRWLAQ